MKGLPMVWLQDVARSFVAWWNRQQLFVRGGLLGGVGLLFGVLVATAVVAGGSGESAVDVSSPTAEVSSKTPTPSPTPRATRTPRATPSATPTATATANPSGGGASVSTIEALVAEYGYPPGYDFARIRIPVIGVDAPVGTSLVDGDQMEVPEGPATVFWYDLSLWQGLGGRPGEGKNAIFSGHVDLASYIPYADVNYRGQAVFSDLGLLTAGDRVFVDYNGQSLEYVVTWREQVNAGNSDRWGEIWSADVPTDSITLYTCGGEFDFTRSSYIDRVVVRAERA